MRNRILNDKSLHPLRVCQRHAETNGTAVILHVKRVAREPERFGEVIHDLRIVIKRVRKLGFS